jgi:hypothetical protein
MDDGDPLSANLPSIASVQDGVGTSSRRQKEDRAERSGYLKTHV